jgi:hypothetical protein
MHCHDEKPSLHGKPDAAVIRQLVHERARIGKSRDAWIQVAFDLKAGNQTSFEKLVIEELCSNCKKFYTKNVKQD